MTLGVTCAKAVRSGYPVPMKVRIEDRNPDGRGRGKDGDRAVLVSQAHPGEVVVVRPDRTTRGTVQGRVARILDRDPTRIGHDCGHEFHCTGCPLLAASAEDEAAFKLDRVRAALAAAGLEGQVPREVVVPTALFGWRHFAKMVFGRRGPHTILGSYVQGTRRLVDNRGCPVLAPPLRDLMDALALSADRARLPVHETGVRVGLRHALARLSRATGEMIVRVVTSEERPEAVIAAVRALRRSVPALAGAEILVETGETADLRSGELCWREGAAEVTEEIQGFQHRVGIDTFFQVNPVAAERLFEAATSGAGTGATCVEGYSGVGALTLPLSRAFGRVVAVEAAAASAARLRAAAEAAGEGRIEVREGRMEALAGEILALAHPDAVVLDPPRKGMGEVVAGEVARSTARRVVLLSCDPEALRVDLGPLRAGGFAVDRVVPIDQFPRTAHVETVTVLSRPAP